MRLRYEKIKKTQLLADWTVFQAFSKESDYVITSFLMPCKGDVMMSGSFWADDVGTRRGTGSTCQGEASQRGRELGPRRPRLENIDVG